ncbi:MAG TPA: tRNA uridine-5-carboxymethylaminomethyl(34) synthesis GTPase MnmE [Rhizomicrobium sp.]|jgi:tRNA modification GTPase|nr:tRNA uridine-5-carboxymethylaminomethyl(34) synthesis GTPase MnmE [Rhizomicrobium sp.]
MRRDTIYALSSAPGRAGVAVVRVSGPDAAGAVRTLTGKPPPVPRNAVLARFFDAAGAAIDHGLVLYFAAPASFTGEDMAEFHIHGGRATVEALLAALAAAGLRPAEPGEFTRRAVENGKLDLTQAEAVADLIDAETDAQRRQALRQYDGILSVLYERWRQELIRATAWAEAAIDFSDEELPADMLARVHAAIREILEEIQRHLNDSARGETLREGLYLTVIGPPNAGKSSLVNALARRDVAIVAETAGTTRDIVEVRMDLGGYLVTLADTAGLRHAAEAVEAEGVRRALARAKSADLVLLLLDGSAEDPMAGLPPSMRADLTVWNKAELPWPARRSGAAISLKTGQGLDALMTVLAAEVRNRLEAPGEAPVLTRKRHRHALEQAARSLEAALAAPPGHPELLAEDLRLALRALGRITGRVDIEQLLDVVFRDFCIGK